MRVFYRVIEVEKYNLTELTKVVNKGNYLYRIQAKNSSNAVALEADDEYWGLKKMLFLCEDAEVYLTVNLNVNEGLYNSSPGKVKKIVYEEGVNHHDEEA